MLRLYFSIPGNVPAASSVGDVYTVDVVVDDPAVRDVDVAGAVTDIESGHVVVPRHDAVMNVDRAVHPFNLKINQ
jgi:hypothetical protein